MSDMPIDSDPFTFAVEGSNWKTHKQTQSIANVVTKS